MRNTLILCLLFLLGINVSMAQKKQDIQDLYMDYTVIRMNDKQAELTIKTALALLERSAELNSKQIANINYHLGRIYETTATPEKAVAYYEASLKIVPGYYVTHRSLGYINLKKCDTLGRKVTEYAKQKNVALYEDSYRTYKAQALKTIAYFEKAEACDPDDRTNAILATLYKSIRDTTSLATLNTRLADLRKDCITLLDDE